MDIPTINRQSGAISGPFRRRKHSRERKPALIPGYDAPIVAAALGFLLPYYRELGLTADDYVVLMRLKRTLVGVVIGIVISIIVEFGRVKPRESGERLV
jgi:hypothetical protein